MSHNLIGPLDEYPIHAAPLPAARPVSSDRNVYDRSYFNVMDTTGGLDGFMAVFGMGYYPNLGTKDAFVLVRRGDEQTALQFGDAIDDDRLNPRVGGMRIEVVEPLQKVRVVVEETEGISAELTWDGSFPVVQELRHLLLAGVRPTLDAQRFAQVGSWTGRITVDGETIDVTPDRFMGSRDRSWGIRPSGESEPEGRSMSPDMEDYGFWWLYMPLRFENYSVVLILQEDADGHRTLNDASRVWADGRVEQLGWPRADIEYEPVTRMPTSAVVRCTDAAGDPLTVTAENLTHAVLHVGGGYGGDPEWNHGQWRGEDFAQRFTWSLNDPEVAGRVPFGVIDHAAKVRCGDDVGFGMFEHGIIGVHRPSGFVDWSNDRER